MDSQRLHHQNKNLLNTQEKKVLFSKSKDKEEVTDLILSPDIKYIGIFKNRIFNNYV